MELLLWSLSGGVTVSALEQGKDTETFCASLQPGPFKFCSSSSTMRFPLAAKTAAPHSRDGVPGELWALPWDQFGCASRACGPCWLLPCAQGSALGQGGMVRSVLATVPAAPSSRDRGVGLTHVWD